MRRGTVIAGSGNHLVGFDRRDEEVGWIATVSGRGIEPGIEPNYLPGHAAVVVGFTDLSLYLVEAATGGVLARYPTDGLILARPVVHGDLHRLEVTVCPRPVKADVDW